MSFVTTAPAPITTLSQIETGKIVAFDPIETPLPIVVDFKVSYFHLQAFHPKKDHL